MLYDILIPYRLGNYYLAQKRILSFEITPMMISAVLIEFSSRTIQIKNHQSIILKDLTAQAQANALKKIASNIGSYDEIITNLASASVVYKELELPFIGRDALAMIVPFEVESLLPFSLEDAVIDFIVTHENLQTKHSKLLVAAVRKEDLQAYTSLFEKAELELTTATIDIFSLYELYKHCLAPAKPEVTQPKKPSFFDIKSSSMVALWQKVHAKIVKKQIQTDGTAPLQTYQPKQAELLVDIGYDVVRVLYLQDGQLAAIRMIPWGVSDIASNIAHNSNLAFYDVMHNILTGQHAHDAQAQTKTQLQNLFEEITRTIAFFEKQLHQRYISSEKILFSGFLSDTATFHEQAQTFFGPLVHTVHSKQIIDCLNIKIKTGLNHLSVFNISLSLFQHFNQFVNFLNNVVRKHDNSLLNKQIFAIILLTSTCLGLTLWKSQSILQTHESAYNASKRQFTQAIQERMHIDLAGEKNIKVIVEKAEEMLKTEKNLWMGFAAQQEHSLLEYLQDLSVHIDRAATGLNLKNIHLDYEKISMNGTIKDFAELNVFEDELGELTLLEPTEQIRELTFNIVLRPKDKKA
jgi:Tfp pilus assembly PilM family ATPase